MTTFSNLSLPFATGQRHGTSTLPEETEDEQLYVASQWQLMWWKFRKHNLAMISGVVVDLPVPGGICSSSLSRRTTRRPRIRQLRLPPADRRPLRGCAGQLLHRARSSTASTSKRNLETLALEFAEDTSTRYPQSASSCKAIAVQAVGPVPQHDRTCLAPETRRRSRSSCWAPTGWAATCSRA